ncbi:MAG: hypothetical protein FWB79_02115 [Treponema sp.]|nr:hypothetical protein [Treponema sp.]
MRVTITGFPDADPPYWETDENGVKSRVTYARGDANDRTLALKQAVRLNSKSPEEEGGWLEEGKIWGVP